MNVEYIYLLKEREFIKTNENIYKVGKTTQKNLDRFKNYPRSSMLICQLICNNCNIIEREVLRIFRQSFISRKDIGSEYFEGNYKNMINVIYSVINYKDYMICEHEKKEDYVDNETENDYIIEEDIEEYIIEDNKDEVDNEEVDNEEDIDKYIIKEKNLKQMERKRNYQREYMRKIRNNQKNKTNMSNKNVDISSSYKDIDLINDDTQKENGKRTEYYKLYKQRKRLEEKIKNQQKDNKNKKIEEFEEEFEEEVEEINWNGHIYYKNREGYIRCANDDGDLEDPPVGIWDDKKQIIKFY